MLIAQGWRIENGELALQILDAETQKPRTITKDVIVLIVNLGPAGEIPVAFPIEKGEAMAEGFRVASTGIIPATAADMPIVGPNGPAQAG